MRKVYTESARDAPKARARGLVYCAAACGAPCAPQAADEDSTAT
ncbi:hypothetical protein [Tychonema sp. LEGE 06208]|nr:hypothetical protein [Tychonema sp. LEGE 06208]